MTFDGATGEPLPTPPANKRPRHIRLRTIDDVRAEAERVYRDSRTGRVPPSEATKLTYILGQIGSLIEQADLERRIEVLEKELEDES